MTAATHMAPHRKRTIRKSAADGVAQAIGTIEPGCELFILTHGQFSLIDAIVYISTQIGPCKLSISTWTAGTEDLQQMASLLAAGQFTACRWLVDRSFISRQPAYCERLRELFGDDVIRTTRSHAKFVTLRNDAFSLAVSTSMNLNSAERMEHIEISDNAKLADYMDGRFADSEPASIPTAPADLFTLRAGRATGARIYRTTSP